MVYTPVESSQGRVYTMLYRKICCASLLVTLLVSSPAFSSSEEKYDACLNSCQIAEKKCLDAVSDSLTTEVRCEHPYKCLDRCSQLYAPPEPK